MSNAGKAIRLNRIFKNGRAVMVPMDDGLISGPEEGLRYPDKKIQEIIDGKADAVLGFKGLFSRNYKLLLNTPMIVNLTASTFRSIHTKKTIIGSVEESISLGADAVGVHVNITSKYESEMINILGGISRECEMLGMPLVALLYPRTEGKDGDDNYLELKKNNRSEYAKLVRHAVKVGVELGADIIKTQFTGDAESFSTVVDICQNVPIVIAGGPKVSEKEALNMAHQTMIAGGSGVCFGRNSYNRTNTTNFVLKLRKIVHEGLNPDEI